MQEADLPLDVVPGDEFVADEPACDDGSDDASETGSQSGDGVWTITDSGAIFTVESEDKSSVGSSEAEKVGIPMSPEKFNDVKAFVMLSAIGLTEIPNVQGCGIGIHFTTNTWQVRYPSEKKASTARTFGDHVKGKGKVSCSAALLQCLLWAWQQHGQKNPSCAVCKHRITILQGALNVGLGSEV